MGEIMTTKGEICNDIRVFYMYAPVTNQQMISS